MLPTPVIEARACAERGPGVARVGLLSFVELPADPGLMIAAYTAEPGSRSQESMSLLASWAATEEAQETVSGDA